MPSLVGCGYEHIVFPDWETPHQLSLDLIGSVEVDILRDEWARLDHRAISPVVKGLALEMAVTESGPITEHGDFVFAKSNNTLRDYMRIVTC